MSAVRDALGGLKEQMLDLAGEFSGDAHDKLKDFAAIGESLVVDYAAGKLTEEQAEEGVRNLALASKSALVDAGYDAHAKAVQVAQAGLTTAIRLVTALAV